MLKNAILDEKMCEDLAIKKDLAKIFALGIAETIRTESKKSGWGALSGRDTESQIDEALDIEEALV